MWCRETYARSKNSELAEPGLQILCACSRQLWHFFLNSARGLRVTEGPMAPFQPSPFLLDSQKAGQHHPPHSHTLLQSGKPLVGVLGEGGRAKPPAASPLHPALSQQSTWVASGIAIQK